MELLDKLITHPYLKSASKRLRIFFDASRELSLYDSADVLESFVQNMTWEEPRFSMPWDTDFKTPIMEGNNEVLKGLKTTYKKGSEVIGIAYIGDDYSSLVYFLRNVYVHAVKSGLFTEYDNYITLKYPGLVSLVHKLVPITLCIV